MIHMGFQWVAAYRGLALGGPFGGEDRLCSRLMVRRGEYLERAVVIPGGPPLEGLYHRGKRAPGILIAPPHPERGGMEMALIAELAWALTRSGHATLRFNYEGVGASAGTFEPTRAGEAAARAFEHLQASVPGPVAGVGVGLGGPVLAEVLGGHPDALVLWVLPQLEALREFDPAGLPGGAWVVLAAGAPKALRSAAEAWAQGHPRGHLITVAGADPTFTKGLVELGRAAVSIFERAVLAQPNLTC